MPPWSYTDAKLPLFELEEISLLGECGLVGGKRQAGRKALLADSGLSDPPDSPHMETDNTILN